MMRSNAAVQLKVVAERAEPVAAERLDHKPLMSRREAEILFEIDGAQTGESEAWESYFVESLVEYLVFCRRPTGQISAEDADWLIRTIGSEWSPSIPALLKALVLQSENVPPAIMRMAMTVGAMRP